MPLFAGTRLGPYEITGSLGAGGMGEVYRARDTRLDRIVAIKVLPDVHATDPEFRSRFEREARAIAALNHRHICTLHDVGRHGDTDYIVMEHIEGQTLAARLEKGALPVAEALGYAIEIADALDRAHRAGIVHRDLKPANVMVTKAGVKLLDFGLAKAGLSAVAASGLSTLPTTPAGVTMQGTILGTLQYMSPEQLQGADADARSDIFAFGAVLYEMLTGRKAFEGRNPASLMSAIMKDHPPPPSAVEPLAPKALDRVIATCLAKDPDDRWQTARDLLRELRWLSDPANASSATMATSAAAAGFVTRGRGVRVSLPILASLLIGTAVLAGGLVWLLARPAPADRIESRWQFAVARSTLADVMTLSRDGRVIVYSGIGPDGVDRLVVRHLNQLEPVGLRGTDRALFPAASPDGSFVAFVDGLQLKKMPIAGGPAVVLAELPVRVAGGLSWGRGDVIVAGGTDGLYRVPAAGGSPVRLTTADTSRKETAHLWPSVVPGGDAVVFAIQRAGAFAFAVAVVPMAGGAPTVLLDGTSPHVTTRGDLLFARAGVLWSARLNEASNGVVGEPAPVLENVELKLSGYMTFDVADNGTLAYVPRRTATQQLSWITRDGTATPAVDDKIDGVYHGPPALSADGTRLAIATHPTGGADQIVLYDLARGIRTPLTAMAGANSRWPVWTPDGARLTFASTREGSWDIFEVEASGAGDPQPLLVAAESQSPAAWTPDGRVLVYSHVNVNTSGIFTLARGGTPSAMLASPPGTGRPILYLSPTFSPDGRWLLYSSDETGRSEVYVRPYPGPGEAVRVSAAGGRDARWAPNGREIFYLMDATLMAVDVRPGAPPTFGQPRRLFSIRFEFDGTTPYTVSPDGTRFLGIQDLNTEPDSIVVVENWAERISLPSGAR